MSSEINWLLLSDLHIGGRTDIVLEQVINDLPDLFAKHNNLTEKCPEIILISGDVANTGIQKEYEKADEIIFTIQNTIKDVYNSKNTPLVIPVPGNHDLLRPQGVALQKYSNFPNYAQSDESNHFTKNLNKILWEEENPAIINDLFLNYSNWSKKYFSQIISKLGPENVHTSYITGDFCIKLNFSQESTLCIVGINSTWLQINDANYQERLSIPFEQYNKIFSGCSDRILRKPNRSILMMHHPPSWLSAPYREIFNNSIFTSDKFDICLFGHNHYSESESSSINTSPEIYMYQSPALCGFSNYKKHNEESIFGLTFGCITDQGKISIWPYTRVSKKGNHPTFELNIFDFKLEEENNLEKGMLLRKRDSRTKKQTKKKTEENNKHKSEAQIEGVFIRIGIADTYKNLLNLSKKDLQNKLSEIIPKFISGNSITTMSCSLTGATIIYLQKEADKSWASLSYEAFILLIKLIVHLRQELFGPTETYHQLPLYVITHLEYKDDDIFDSISEYDHTAHSTKNIFSKLPMLSRSNIIFSSDVYKNIFQFISNKKQLRTCFIQEKIITENNSKADIEFTPISSLITSSDSHFIVSSYNFTIKAENGFLLLGDNFLPSESIRMDITTNKFSKNIIQNLVESENVWIIKENCDGLLDLLKTAFSIRNNLNKGFWNEIKILIASKKIAEHIEKSSSIKNYSINQNTSSNFLWSKNTRKIRDFLIDNSNKSSQDWDFRKYDQVLPFEAFSFDDNNKNSFIQLFPFRSKSAYQDSICIEVSEGNDQYKIINDKIASIFNTATPIWEFNVLGKLVNEDFNFLGVIEQQGWRDFKLSDNEIPCFPVSFIILHTKIKDRNLLVLQYRTPENCGGDFYKYSLISGKVNDEDFFDFGIPSETYKKSAYYAIINESEKYKHRLSETFGLEIEINPNEPIPENKMNMAWKNTAIREINDKLGLSIDETDLKFFPEDFQNAFNCKKNYLIKLKNADTEFFLFVKLFTLEISYKDVEQIIQDRPSTNIVPISKAGFQKHKQKGELSAFLSEYHEDIQHLLEQALKIN